MQCAPGVGLDITEVARTARRPGNVREAHTGCVMSERCEIVLPVDATNRDVFIIPCGRTYQHIRHDLPVNADLKYIAIRRRTGSQLDIKKCLRHRAIFQSVGPVA